MRPRLPVYKGSAAGQMTLAFPEEQRLVLPEVIADKPSFLEFVDAHGTRRTMRDVLQHVVVGRAARTPEEQFIADQLLQRMAKLAPEVLATDFTKVPFTTTKLPRNRRLRCVTHMVRNGTKLYLPETLT